MHEHTHARSILSYDIRSVYSESCLKPCQVRQTQAVDCAMVIEEVQAVRRETARGREVDVCSITVLDDSNSRATITCWEEQAHAVQGRAKASVLILGMLAIHDNGQVKLSVRSSSVLDFRKTLRTEALEKFAQDRTDDALTKCVTQAWSGSSAPSCDGAAVLLCAAFLKAVSKEEQFSPREPFQLMGVYATANLSDIHTKDGQRLFVSGVLRDWSGSVPVAFLENCVPVLTNCSDKEEVESKFANNELVIAGAAFNVRGFKQGQDYNIAQISVADLFAEPTQNALKLADLATVCGPSSDGIVACAATQLCSNGLLNLGVKSNADITIAPYRVLLLVEGTQKSKLITAGTTTAARIVVSEKVKCLLSAEATHINVRAYASEDMLLDYKLDSETAVIFVSALKFEGGTWVCVIDRMHKLDRSKEEREKAIKCMSTLQAMSMRPREAKDEKRAFEMVTPESMKRARTIHSYPSDA